MRRLKLHHGLGEPNPPDSHGIVSGWRQVHESMVAQSPRRIVLDALRRTMRSGPAGGTQTTLSSRASQCSDAPSLHSVRSFTSDAEAVPLAMVPLEDPAEGPAMEEYLGSTLPLQGADACRLHLPHSRRSVVLASALVRPAAELPVTSPSGVQLCSISSPCCICLHSYPVCKGQPRSSRSPRICLRRRSLAESQAAGRAAGRVAGRPVRSLFQPLPPAPLLASPLPSLGSRPLAAATPQRFSLICWSSSNRLLQARRPSLLSIRMTCRCALCSAPVAVGGGCAPADFQTASHAPDRPSRA